MATLKIKEDLLPLSELKARSGEIVDQTVRTGRPVVLTRHGKGAAVLLSVEAFEEMQADTARLRLLAALKEADQAAARGEVHDQKEVDELLKRWERDGA